MNKAKQFVLLLFVCVFAVGLYAAVNPEMGTWKLNETKSKIAPGSAKNTTVTYAPDGDKVKVTVDGVDGSGNPVHGEWVGKFDGKPYAVTGDPRIDMRAVKLVNERTLDITNMKDGKVTGTAKVVVAKDGKTRELTTISTVNGKKVDNHFIYDKQ